MPVKGLNGLLQSLAGMPGARHVTETQESVRFEVAAIREATDQIRRLQGTGQLIINYADGKANGLAEWRPSGKDRQP